MLLAADPEEMKPVSTIAKYHHNVTYVGTGGGLAIKRDLGSMLREAIPFGLVLYGTAWGDYPEFKPYWRGVLPKTRHQMASSAPWPPGRTAAQAPAQDDPQLRGDELKLSRSRLGQLRLRVKRREAPSSRRFQAYGRAWH